MVYNKMNNKVSNNNNRGAVLMFTLLVMK